MVVIKVEPALIKAPSSYSTDFVQEFPLFTELFHWQECGSKNPSISQANILSNGKKVKCKITIQTQNVVKIHGNFETLGS